MPAERDISSATVAYCRKRGGMAIKLTSQAGLPDYLILMPRDEFCFVEFKTRSGKLSRVQRAAIRSIRGLTPRVVVVRTKADGRRLIDALENKDRPPMACIDEANLL